MLEEEALPLWDVPERRSRGCLGVLVGLALSLPLWLSAIAVVSRSLL